MPPKVVNKQPEVGFIVPFPARKRVGTIKRTAFKLVTARTQREADALWFRHVETMRRQMLRAGISDARAKDEIAAYRACVQAEMSRLFALYNHVTEGEPA